MTQRAIRLALFGGLVLLVAGFVAAFTGFDTPPERLERTTDEEKFILVDLVVMNEPYGQRERDAYSTKTQEIAKEYGIEQVQSYAITQFVAGQGPRQALELNLWTMDDPGAMQKLSSDPAYQARVPFRDVVHDMEALTLYMATPKLQRGMPDASKTVLIDFVVMNEGFGQAERDAYNEAIEGIAAKYGVERFASYQIVQYIGGAGPENVLELNLWSMDDPAAMQRFSSDPAYQANIENRNRIHDMEAVTLYLAKPKSASEAM